MRYLFFCALLSLLVLQCTLLDAATVSSSSSNNNNNNNNDNSNKEQTKDNNNNNKQIVEAKSEKKKEKASTKQKDDKNKQTNKQTADKEFKYSSGSLKITETKTEKNDQKKSSTKVQSLIQPASKELHIDSEKSTDKKLMKMLNSEKNPKLSFPKSGHDQVIFGDRYDTKEKHGAFAEKPKNGLKRHRNSRHLAKKHQREETQDEGHFNVFKLKHSKRPIHKHHAPRHTPENTYRPLYHSKYNRKDIGDREEYGEPENHKRHYGHGHHHQRPFTRHHAPYGSEDSEKYQKSEDVVEHEGRHRQKKREYEQDHGNERHASKRVPWEGLGGSEMNSRNHMGSMNMMDTRSFMGMSKSDLGHSRRFMGEKESEDFGMNY